MAMINGWYVRPGKLSARRDNLALKAVAAQWQDYLVAANQADQPGEDGDPTPDAPGVLVTGNVGETIELCYFILLYAPGGEKDTLTEFAKLYSPEYAASRDKRREQQYSAEWKVFDRIAIADLGCASLVLSRHTFATFMEIANAIPGQWATSPMPDIPPDEEGFILITTMINGMEFPAWLNSDLEWLNFDTVEELTNAVSPQRLYAAVAGVIGNFEETGNPVSYDDQFEELTDDQIEELFEDLIDDQPEPEEFESWQISNQVASRVVGDMLYSFWEKGRTQGGNLLMYMEMTTPGVKTSRIILKLPPEMEINSLKDFLRSEACRGIIRMKA